jgi:hypothetical protein
VYTFGVCLKGIFSTSKLHSPLSLSHWCSLAKALNGNGAPEKESENQEY